MERVIHGEEEWGVSDGIAEVGVARGVSMNLKFVEGGET